MNHYNAYFFFTGVNGCDATTTCASFQMYVDFLSAVLKNDIMVGLPYGHGHYIDAMDMDGQCISRDSISLCQVSSIVQNNNINI
jgi:hypothetical protein